MYAYRPLRESVTVSNTLGDGRVNALSGSIRVSNLGGVSKRICHAKSRFRRGKDVKYACRLGTFRVQETLARTSYWNGKTASGTVTLIVPAFCDFHLRRKRSPARFAPTSIARGTGQAFSSGPLGQRWRDSWTCIPSRSRFASAHEIASCTFNFSFLYKIPLENLAINSFPIRLKSAVWASHPFCASFFHFFFFVRGLRQLSESRLALRAGSSAKQTFAEEKCSEPSTTPWSTTVVVRWSASGGTFFEGYPDSRQLPQIIPSPVEACLHLRTHARRRLLRTNRRAQPGRYLADHPDDSCSKERR